MYMYMYIYVYIYICCACLTSSLFCSAPAIVEKRHSQCLHVVVERKSTSSNVLTTNVLRTNNVWMLGNSAAQKPYPAAAHCRRKCRPCPLQLQCKGKAATDWPQKCSALLLGPSTLTDLACR